MNNVLELLRLPVEVQPKNIKMARSTKCIERTNKI